MSTAPFPGKRKPKKRGKQKTVPAGMRKMFERSLQAPEAEIEAYQPTPLVLDICEAYLSGARTHQEIGEHIEKDRQTVSAALRDPVACAWVSRTLHQAIQQRLGLVDAAAFSTAVAGNVAAMKLVFERYGQLVDRKVNVHVHTQTGIPFEEMATEDLESIVKSKGNAIIDVTSEESA